MKKFLVQTILFLTLLIISVYWVILQADGHADPFYLRFTTPRQSSLILGTSKAAQGIQPAVLNKILSRNDMYNFAFTIDHSAYGPTYLKAIKKKLSPHTNDGIFILSVDPWSISSTTKDPNDTSQFIESRLCLGNTPKVDSHPNFSYLYENFNGNFFNMLWSNSPTYLHKDGWLEITVAMDSFSVHQRIKKGIKMYKDIHLKRYHFSNIRFTYLLKTIDFLKEHGAVYLVRLPVPSEMMKIETDLMPDFDNKMQEIVQKTSINYLDLTPSNSQLTFTDGNHLYKQSGEMVTRLIAQWILDKKSCLTDTYK